LFVPSSAHWPSAHIVPSVHGEPRPPCTPGPGTQRPPMHVSVLLAQSDGFWHGGPMFTSIAIVPTAPWTSVAVTSTWCMPSARSDGALNAYGCDVRSGGTAAPSTLSETFVITASFGATAVAVTLKPGLTLAPNAGFAIVTTGGGGVATPNRFL